MHTSEYLWTRNFQRAQLLVVEDNDDVWFLTKTALVSVLPEVSLIRRTTPQSSMAYLARCIEGTLPLPKLILQDLYLPGKVEGVQLLTDFRQGLSTTSHPHLPIVVLSASTSEADVQDCYRHGATSYIVKPVSQSQLLSHFLALRNFWWESSVLPQAESTGASA